MKKIIPFLRTFGLVAAAVGLSVLAGCAGMPASSVDTPLAIAKQGSFFVGGRELQSNTLSGLPAARPMPPAAGGSAPPDPNIGTVSVEQMYVQYQIPAAALPTSLVLIHGCCLTGASWESTPDGRMGWAEYFARRRYPTYVVDQVARGRSAMNATPIAAVKTGKLAVDQLPAGYMVGREFAWSIFRFGDEYPKVHPDLQFPLQAQGELWKQMVPDYAFSFPAPNPTVPALGLLAQRIGGPVVLVSHSQSGIYPFLTYAQSPRNIAGIVSIEPTSCPASPGDAERFAAVPVLLLWGDHTESSAFWAPRIRQCREFADAVNRAGGNASFLVTAERGMKGNSHMLMQDKNNIAVADLVLQWIGRTVR